MPELLENLQFPTLESLFGHNSFLYSDADPYKHWLVVYTESRDSEPLIRSNMRVLLKRLQAVSDNGVKVVRASHWAFGWLDYLCIDPDNVAVKQLASGLYRDMEQYPVLDEKDLAELELEYNHAGHFSFDPDPDCPLCREEGWLEAE